jgi:hypothetical protein
MNARNDNDQAALVRKLKMVVVVAALCALLAGLGVVWLVMTPGPSLHDPTSDFTITNDNPNGVWSYGWMQVGFVGPLVLYTNTISSPAPNWQGRLGRDGTPAIWKNTTGVKSYGIPPGSLALHPGPGTEPSVLRWTAPAGGHVQVQGQFEAGDSGSMQVAVRLAGQPWWSSVDAGAFDLQTNLAAGATVDFAVYGGYYGGNTPLSVLITLTPGRVR